MRRPDDAGMMEEVGGGSEVTGAGVMSSGSCSGTRARRGVAAAGGAAAAGSVGLDATRSLLAHRGGGFLGIGGGKAAVAVSPPAPSAASKQQGSSSSSKPLSKAAQAIAEEQRAQASTLWTVKVLFLLFYGSLGSVMPYLPVYYHSLGLPGAYPT